MSETNEETQAENEAGGEESGGPKALREKLAQVEAQLEEERKRANRQRMQLLEGAFKDVGLDPTQGLGKAIAKEYDGDPTVEALAEFAEKEYGFVPQSGEGGEHPLAGDINAGNQRAAQARAGTESMPSQQIDLDIQKAEESGDFATSMTLKMQKYLSTR